MAKRDSTTDLDGLVEEAGRAAAGVPRPAKGSGLKKTRPAAARRRQVAAVGQQRNLRITPDAAMTAMFDLVTKESGGRQILTSEESERLVCGLQLPSLAPRFLLQQDILPLSRSLMIYGDPGSAKSAFLFELYRWFLLHQGLCVHDNNEGKDSPDLRNAILWYDPGLMARVRKEDSTTQEGWMRIFFQWLQAYEEQFARTTKPKKAQKPKQGEGVADYRRRVGPQVRKDKPGFIYPFLFGIDSLTATSSEATLQGIADRGAPQRRYQIEAAYLSDFAKTLPDWLLRRPIVLAAVNHRKDLVDEHTGVVRDKIPGGNAMLFMITTNIRMQRVAKLKTVDYGGLRIRMAIPKNSLGEGDGAITVDMKWWWELDDRTGRPVQRVLWDWDAAAIDMLLAQKKASARRWQAIQDIVDLHEVDGHRIWSKALDIPASQPATYAEAGRRLEANRELVTALYGPLHIKERAKFVPGVPYEDYQGHLAAALEERAPVYAPRDLAGVAFIEDELAAAAAPKRARKPPAGAADEAPEDDEDGE